MTMMMMMMMMMIIALSAADLNAEITVEVVEAV